MSHYPGAGQSQPFVVTDHPEPAGPAKRSSTLGVLGLVLVVTYLVVAIVARWLTPDIHVYEMSSTSESMGRLGAEVLPQLVLPLLMMASGVIGLAGWVLGIVATVTNRGRVFGVAAIILGVVAFLIASTSMIGMLFVFSS
jgi:hypothetical protein